MTTTYTNPVISGFNPDPSVCRVGDDYYLVASSFEYFPGVPIYHSKDLVHWRLIGHALTRNSQLPLAGLASSKGIFAPTIRCHAGQFIVITTNMEGGGTFYVTATDPAGEWSEPIWLKEPVFTMDPSLFFDDDGKVYYTRHGEGRNGGIFQAEIDLQHGKLMTEPRLIWRGTGDIWPEGPHLYKVNGTYYLMISEGGTSYEHMVTIARSASPWGPFEANPSNPIVTHRFVPDNPIQALGHADLVQTSAGSWFMVLLGIRPTSGKHHHLGRETFVAPVTWSEQGWPVVNGGAPLGETVSAPGLPDLRPWPARAVRDGFDVPDLALHWAFVRNPKPGMWSTAERPGWLRLHGNRATLNDVASPAFVGQAQRDFAMRASTRLDFSPTDPRQAAGLVVRADEANHYALLVTHGAAQKLRRVQLQRRVAGETTLVADLPLTDGPVILTVTSSAERYTFGFQAEGGQEVIVGQTDTASLASENTGGFTGAFLGLYATQGGSTRPVVADFDWFDYEPIPSASGERAPR